MGICATAFRAINDFVPLTTTGPAFTVTKLQFAHWTYFRFSWLRTHTRILVQLLS